jgi:hypothetical protein
MAELPANLTFAKWADYQHPNATHWIKVHFSIVYDKRTKGSDGALGRLLRGMLIACAGHGEINVRTWIGQCTDKRSARNALKRWIDNGLLIPVPDNIDREIERDIKQRERTAFVERASESVSAVPVSSNGNGRCHEEPTPAALALVPVQPPGLALAVERRGNGSVALPMPNPLVEQRTEERRKRDAYRHGTAAYLFGYWAHRLGHGQALFDPQREARILKRLDEADGKPRDLLFAIDGALKDPYLMGRDPRTEGKRYDGVQTIFRDRAQVERLAGLCPAWLNGSPHPEEAKIPALLGLALEN